MENNDVSHVFAALQNIPNLSEDEKKHFVASADFGFREFLLHYSKIYPEAREVARKLALQNPDKPSVAVMAFNLKIDFTNLNHLKVESTSTVTSYKLKLSGEADEDLAQMKFDFSAGTIEHAEPVEEEEGATDRPEASGEVEAPGDQQPGADAPKGDAPSEEEEAPEDLAAKTLDELKVIADELTISYTTKIKKQAMIDAIVQARAQKAEHPEGVEEFVPHNGAAAA